MLRIWSALALERIRRLPIGYVILIGLMARLLIAPWFHGFQYDVYIFSNWADTLANQPLSKFYGLAEAPDHLPGDLLIHWLVAVSFQAFGGTDFFGNGYRFVLKAIPALFDCLLIWLCYRVVIIKSDRSSAIKIVWALTFAPALIFISAVWGQWDTVSMSMLLAGCLLLWKENPRPYLASALIAWCLLIKPPLLLLALPALAGYAYTQWKNDRRIMQAALQLFGMLITGIVVVSAMMWPFGMTWFKSWGPLSLQDQLVVAADLYPFTTLGAANIWMLPLGRPDRATDKVLFLGISLQSIGLVLLCICLVWIAIRLVKAQLELNTVAWSMAATSYAYFLLPTRSHERYLFPAIIMMAICAALTEWRPMMSRLFAIASVLYFLNLVFVYRTPSGLVGVVIFELVSVLHIFVFVRWLLLPQLQISPRSPSHPVAVQIERE